MGTKRKREQNEMGTNMNIVKRIHCKWEPCQKGSQEKGNIAKWEQTKRENTSRFLNVQTVKRIQIWTL